MTKITDTAILEAREREIKEQLYAIDYPLALHSLDYLREGVDRVPMMQAIMDKVGNRPFYADDVHVEGGIMNGLRMNGFIKETGNFREVMIPTGDPEDNTYRKVKVKEWELAITPEQLALMIEYIDIQKNLTVARIMMD